MADVVFIADPQLDIQTEANIQGVPALLIEVLSDARMDRGRKRDLYEHFGVPEHWIVDPGADHVEVYRPTAGRYGAPDVFTAGDVLTFDPLPGFALDVTKLFSR